MLPIEEILRRVKRTKGLVHCLVLLCPLEESRSAVLFPQYLCLDFFFLFSWWISGAQRTSKRDWPDFKAWSFCPLFRGGEPLPDFMPQLSWYLSSLQSCVSSVHYWLSFLSFSWFALWTRKNKRKYWTLMILQTTFCPLRSLSLSLFLFLFLLLQCIFLFSPSTAVQRWNQKIMEWYFDIYFMWIKKIWIHLIHRRCQAETLYLYISSFLFYFIF